MPPRSGTRNHSEEETRRRTERSAASEADQKVRGPPAEATSDPIRQAGCRRMPVRARVCSTSARNSGCPPSPTTRHPVGRPQPPSTGVVARMMPISVIHNNGGRKTSPVETGVEGDSGCFPRDANHRGDSGTAMSPNTPRANGAAPTSMTQRQSSK